MAEEHVWKLRGASTFKGLLDAAEAAGLSKPLGVPFSAMVEELGLSRSLGQWLGNEELGSVAQFLADEALQTKLRSRLPNAQVRRLLASLAEWLISRLDDAGTRPRQADELPQNPTELLAWAEAQGVADLARISLLHVPDEVFTAQSIVFRTQYQPVGRMFDLAVLRGRRDALQLRDALWAWLAAEAKAVKEARSSPPLRPPRPTDAVLGELFDRLSKVRELFDRDWPPRARSTKVSIALIEDPLALDFEVAQFEASSTGFSSEQPHVQVTLPRTGAPFTGCSCGRRHCVHIAMCLDVALRVLSDDHPVPKAIRAELMAPVWQKALGFEAKLAVRRPADERLLGFVVHVSKQGVQLTLTAQRLGKKKGASGPVKKVGALYALTLGNLTAIERKVCEQLALYEREVDYDDHDPVFLASALLGLVGHPRVTCLDADTGAEPTPLSVELARIELDFESTPAGLVAHPMLGGKPFFFEQTYALPTLDAKLVVSRAGERLLLTEADNETLSFLAALARYRPTFPAEAHDALLVRLEELPRIDVELPASLAGTEVPPDAKLVVRVEPSDLEGMVASVQVRPLQGGEPVVPGEGGLKFAVRKDQQRFHTTRNLDAERAQADALVKSLDLPARLAEGPYSFRVNEPLEAVQLVDRLEGLARAGLDVEWPKTRWRLSRAAKTKDVKMQVSRKRDWFGLDGEVEVDGERVRLAVLLDAVRRRRPWVRLKDKQWLRLSEDLMEKLQSLSNLANEGKEGLEVTWAALPALDALQGQVEQLEVAKDFGAMLQRVRDAGALDPQVPKGLKAELRDYQVEGFRWLARLAAWGAGACLADDMGLGKTLQALALLLSRAEEGPAVVVAPTSVVFNWSVEAAKFAPSLKVHEYRTADRGELLSKVGPHDVVLVSWALLTRDAEAFAAREFATLVLDEAQAIKNAGTLRAKAARGVKAGFKVALSGTPVENHLGELWSLFRVVLPGLFGSEEQFRLRFAGPIERTKDENARQALAAVVRPFLLRRNKSEVAKELPARTEVSLMVELTEQERRLYDDARLAAVSELKGGGAVPTDKRFAALAALTRLRQIACHPRLYDAQWSGPASKLSRLLELLSDLKDGGHRVLVFSQFTSHLALVRDAVTAAGFTYQYLDGATPAAARQQRVEAFQKGDGELFLISLKAGGMGLNLTAADYVVHLDPWWNPAVEDQATDRAHRIGQLKPVTVYRLISQGTVEEGILSLHADKRNLVAGVLDGTAAAGSMTTEELIGLISGS